jgi:predicted thioesterase
MKSSLVPGITFTFRYPVPEDKTVPHVYPESPRFREMPAVFATAYLVGLLEWACIEAIQVHLDAGEQSVGTGVWVTHTAATPPGLQADVLGPGPRRRRRHQRGNARAVRDRPREVRSQSRGEGRGRAASARGRDLIHREKPVTSPARSQQPRAGWRHGRDRRRAGAVPSAPELQPSNTAADEYGSASPWAGQGWPSRARCERWFSST